MSGKNQTTDASRRRGFVLVSILIVVMLISMIAISLMFRLRAEERAAAAGIGGEQAWAAAMSGVRHAMRVLTSASSPADWEDNPELFKGRFVFDDGAIKWYFSIYSAPTGFDQLVRYGLVDEAGKLNVNRATEESLLQLPLVQPEHAHALLDFIDEDDEPRKEGAEQEYYDTLEKPYAIHNSALITLEELLLVRGFSPALLYGEDANLNFRLDANEDDGDERFPPDNANGELSRGLRSLLTVVSYDLNVDSDGNERVDINDPAVTLTNEPLPEKLVTFIAALRRNERSITNVSELLEAKWEMADEKGKQVEYESGVGKEELADVLDRLTHTNATQLSGLINVNTATEAVLKTVPGIDDDLAGAIAAARIGSASGQGDSIAWLYTEDIVDVEKFQEIAPYLTARSYQFSFHAIGFGSSGQYRILEVIVDTATDTPRIVYLRDLTRSGLPFPLEIPEGDVTDADPFVSDVTDGGNFETEMRGGISFSSDQFFTMPGLRSPSRHDSSCC